MVNLKYPFQRVVDEFSDKFYDRQYGIETCRQTELDKMDISVEKAENARKYQATPYVQLKKIFQCLDQSFEKWSLMDVGAGKGRVLITAADCGASEVIGVDFSSELTDQAKRNISMFKKLNPNNKTKFKIIESDILDLELDKSTDVYFLFNPFDSVILQQFIEQLKYQGKKDAKIVVVNSIRLYLWQMSGYQIEKTFDHSNENFKAYLLSAI